MIQDAYVQYQSPKAAQDMFEAMVLVNNKITFNTPDYIDEETAAANLDVAQMQQALLAEA